MNLRNIMKERVLALTNPDDQPAVKRFALDVRKQIKKRNIEETPFLTLRVHAVLVAFVRMLCAERLVLSGEPSDAAARQWDAASEALQKATDDLEKALDKQEVKQQATVSGASLSLLDKAEDTATEPCEPGSDSVVGIEDRAAFSPPAGISAPDPGTPPDEASADASSADASSADTVDAAA